MASKLTLVQRQRQKLRERVIIGTLFAASSVLITLGIVGVLLYESFEFFRHVRVLDFLTDTQWTPLFAEPRYGMLPLLCGTLLSTLVALAVAAPLGLTAALYLSEFARPRTRETIKPIL
jgi:phosphate transport system permease protein